MENKPGDFFVGVVDFFAVLLPGSLLSFLAEAPAQKHVFGPILEPIHSATEGWAVFIFASYLLGQFATLLGATFMDWTYDHTYLAYKRRNGDPRYDKAKELQGNYSTIAGTLKWASAYVRLQSADAAAEMDRLDATSKFFRSLVVVLLIYAITLLWTSRGQAFAFSVVFLALSFWRFANQRWKYTELAYLFFIELNLCPELTAKLPRSSASMGISSAP
jgi:hypothetical protein